jgi:hypothetical protein
VQSLEAWPLGHAASESHQNAVSSAMELRCALTTIVVQGEMIVSLWSCSKGVDLVYEVMLREEKYANRIE